MQKPLKLALLAGSLRKNSLNQSILDVLQEYLPTVNTTDIKLSDYDMPLFNQDLVDEQKVPESIIKFREHLNECNSLIIASPEYNGSISGVLKNAIDWASVKLNDEPVHLAFRGKPVGIIGASPGALGTVRALPHLTIILGCLGCYVFPDSLGIGGAHKLADNQRQQLKDFAEGFVKFAERLV